MTESTNNQIVEDQPLPVGRAAAGDKLNRSGFAATAVKALEVVGPSRSIVISIEGAWGSGKTSTLALIQEAVSNKAQSPIIVRFNPWLIGDRESLLRQYLAALAAAITMADRAGEGKRVSRELKAYAKAFDVIKLIPGAEPWASLVKSVIEAAGEATQSVSEYKTPDIERQKSKVEEALRAFPRKVFVFIDDVDRLFPVEVFEIVRIIKSVGELPNIGYVVAWDPGYVVKALKAVSIPSAETYLDKVVQVRLPLPAMSLTTRSSLINEALGRLPSAAHRSQFPNADERLSLLYWSGLRELLEQPRDVIRVFNTVALIEPRLRGELILSDIIGLASLMVKAPAVFETLKREPRWFVGNLPGDSAFRNSKEVAAAGRPAVEEAIQQCATSHAVQKLVNQLFPLTSEDHPVLESSSRTDGRISTPSRLLIALQLSVSEADISLVAARTFLQQPAARSEILQRLTSQNCLEFLEALGDVAESLEGTGVEDLDRLCVQVCGLADTDPFATRAKDRSSFYLTASEDVALRATELIVKSVDADRAEHIAISVAEDSGCTTTAVQLFVRSYLSANSRSDYLLRLPDKKRRGLARTVAGKVLKVAKTGMFDRTANPGYVLFALAEISPTICRKVFRALAEHDPNWDAFVSFFMMRSFDSFKGQIYALPEDVRRLTAYISLDELKRHARKRLRDPSLMYPIRAAWQSIVDGQAVYGVDGSQADR